jgi:hypothetical protein
MFGGEMCNVSVNSQYVNKLTFKPSSDCCQTYISYCYFLLQKLFQVL